MISCRVYLVLSVLFVFLLAASLPSVLPIEPSIEIMRKANILIPPLALILLFLGVAFYVFFRSRERMVDGVISEIRAGNLKARFEENLSPLTDQFNAMADEVEELVETVRSRELARTRRIQELAHDLRTPVASLKNIIETLREHQSGISPEKTRSLLDLSLKEVDYFARFLDSMLFLAHVQDPEYHLIKTELEISELLADQLEAMRSLYPLIEVNARFPDRKIIKGDVQLLQRLFRNGFDNAFGHARSRISVFVVEAPGTISILIQDDGPGFSKEAIESFGVKRLTRFVSASGDARLSLGLGSVTMRAILKLHNGRLEIRNRQDHNQKIIGSEVEIVLPV